MAILKYCFYRTLEKFARYNYRRNLTRKIEAEDLLYELQGEAGFCFDDGRGLSKEIVNYSNKEFRWHAKAENYARKRRQNQTGRLELGDCSSWEEFEKFEDAGEIKEFEVEPILEHFEEILTNQ